jgi:putative MATE family efflux protein
VSQEKNPTGDHARFVTGSIGRHVVVMTMTAAIGLMSLFLVDFADLYFLSLLGETAITSAIGFAGLFAFASMSISIGIGIAGSALTAQNLGAGRRDVARRFATSSLVIAAVVPLATSVVIFIFAKDILFLLGARGAALDYGVTYLHTVAIGFPLLGAAISCSFGLRAIGDPKRAMYVTLATAIGNGVLDPIFIFGLDMSIQGAALATVIADLMSFAIGFYGLKKAHDFIIPVRVSIVLSDVKYIAQIATPATLTQLATPFSIGYITWASAPFGDEAVAGVAIINRLVPVAFGIVFSLSGAVGPIVGQNFGAGDFTRVRVAVNRAMQFNLVYTTIVAAILWMLADNIPGWFLAKGDAITVIVLFCSGLSLSWIFAGAQFVAQAAFNNLEKPKWSMYFNWGKATLGTIPFVIISVKTWGFVGIIIGYSIGSVVFGILATISIYVFVQKLEQRGNAG